LNVNDHAQIEKSSEDLELRRLAPIGMCSVRRVTARGAVSSFHFDNAWFTAGRAE
jgi:hypothetical protein